MQSSSQNVTISKSTPSFFYRPDALPVIGPTMSERKKATKPQWLLYMSHIICVKTDHEMD